MPRGLCCKENANKPAPESSNPVHLSSRQHRTLASNDCLEGGTSTRAALGKGNGLPKQVCLKTLWTRYHQNCYRPPHPVRTATSTDFLPILGLRLSDERYQIPT
eukprot:4861025-Amphidinium_carterae.1